MNSSRLRALALFLCSIPAATFGATYTVTNAGDTAIGGTLRWAILSANTNAGADTIGFSVPSGTTISPTGNLPLITGAMTTVDGTTMAGYAGLPLVRVDGAMLRTNGLVLFASGCVVRAVAVARFVNFGMDVRNVNNCVIQGCHVLSNGYAGISVAGSWNAIGGTNALQRNVISVNTNGIYLAQGWSNNTIAGNYIGTDAAGTRSMGDQYAGIVVDGNPNATIGRTNTGGGNVISGNGTGIQVSWTNAYGAVIQNNLIGPGADGTTAVGNSGNGVYIYLTGKVRVGGTNSGERNIIASNRNGVVVMYGSSNVIRGNYIGVTAGGATMSNLYEGVYILHAPSNVIGGAIAGAGNVIGGNAAGIYLEGTNTCGTIIQGNYLGTDPAGALARPNDENGIELYEARQTQIGGTNALARNVISGNARNGIADSGSDGDTFVIEGNYIGVDAAGTTRMSNHWQGIALNQPHGRIGGTNATQRNIISGNGTAGIVCGGYDLKIYGNYVGVDVTGTNPLSNDVGIEIVGGGAYAVEIGKDGAGGGNVVCASTNIGIYVTGGCSNITVANNFVGVDITGTRVLGNRSGIVLANVGPTNLIGGSKAQRNVIAGSSMDAIAVSYSAGVVIRANYVGVDTNLNVVGNPGYGIQIQWCRQCELGGASASDGNVVGGSGNHGIEATSCSNGYIRGNMVGVTMAGVASNGGAGVSAIGCQSVDIRDNIVSANGQCGIQLLQSSMCTVALNRVGTDTTGTGALGNMSHGIYVTGPGAVSNVIGGSDGLSGNVVSGNREQGIFANGSDVSYTLIAGNKVGVNMTGMAAVPNGVNGIIVYGAQFTTVGGTNVGSRNIVSGNGEAGIVVADVGAVIQGNYIGTDVTGSNAVPNALDGIALGTSASGCLVGGFDTNGANRIWFNRRIGVDVSWTAGSGNAVLGNTFKRNESLGIDLYTDGPTPNDDLDPDLGPNRLQNYPVLLSATNNGTDVTVVGYLNSLPATTFLLELFGSRDPDLSGYGEGEVLMCRTNLTLPPGGQAGFTGRLSVVSYVPNFITATATAIPNNDTSEFSKRILLDSDGDGMGDGYEAQYFGGYTNGNPSGDNDTDNMDNLTEFVCETDPLSAASKLALTRIWREFGDWYFTANASDCRSYAWEYCPDLMYPIPGLQWWTGGGVESRTNGAVTIHDGYGTHDTNFMNFRISAAIP